MSGALTTLKHMEITNATGAGALTTQYGLYINSLTKGTGGNYAIYSVGGSIYSGGSVGLGVTSPTAVLHLKAGTAAASTAPLKFTSGTLQTTAEAGTIEYDGTKFYITPTAGNRVALSAGSPKYFVTSGSAVGSSAEALCDSEATGYHVCFLGEWLGRGYDTGEATTLTASTYYWVQAGGSCTGQKVIWDPTTTTTDFGWSMSTTTYACGANSGKVVCCTD